ncbi:hypothetical protein DM02DRAFT_656474 [Periconia macrospinosa]|uniref:Uncharacterized protein n=1 Tax=Periconia macrospinosa TaxID=97972 RepID=A0A2V1DPV0_9PLEO|nr:hypothetical protein DM02DRAFT_656474 [Periconia macrospinosa]
MSLCAEAGLELYVEAEILAYLDRGDGRNIGAGQNFKIDLNRLLFAVGKQGSVKVALTETSFLTVWLLQQFPVLESTDINELWVEKLNITASNLNGCKV